RAENARPHMAPHVNILYRPASRPAGSGPRPRNPERPGSPAAPDVRCLAIPACAPVRGQQRPPVVRAVEVDAFFPGPERAEGHGGQSMLRIGGTASPGHITVFRGLKTHFQQQGIELDWVLYADYDALVNAFATREIDLAWNGPISYVHIKQRLNDPCRVVAMRDVDVNFSTQLFTRRDSSITTLADLKGKRVALGSRGSAQAGLLP